MYSRKYACMQLLFFFRAFVLSVQGWLGGLIVCIFFILGALRFPGIPDFIEDGTLFFHQFCCILCKLLIPSLLTGMMVRLSSRG